MNLPAVPYLAWASDQIWSGKGWLNLRNNNWQNRSMLETSISLREIADLLSAIDFGR
jgi:hypothetical protein